MKIKVCGMRNSENIQDLLVLKPDFVGFIFYEKSKRFVSDFPQVNFPNYIKKVGIFVNEEISEVLNKVYNFQLNYIQLHGNETVEYCEKIRHSELDLKPLQIKIIKAFSVNDNFDFSKTEPFEKYCDYFLFDTKGKNYGGNGVKFNWEILQKYEGKTPFLLSGGITKEDVNEIKEIKHTAFAGIDINSGFETAPAIKNINNIKEFKNNLL
jgi:phosphoribosylanthranilate isomerase